MAAQALMPPEEGEEYATPLGKHLEHVGVAAGVYLATRNATLAGAAGAVDFGLHMLYEQVPQLGMLSPVRGGIASATAQWGMGRF